MASILEHFSAAGAQAIRDPITRAAAITPDDDDDLTEVTRAIYTGAGGNISMILKNDTSAVTFSDAPAGAILPLRVKRVRSTSTTATGLVALY